MVVRLLTVAVALLNVGDIVLHVAIDQVEPLRVTGNIVVILAAIGVLAFGALRRPATPIAAAVVNLALNLVFIAIFGIGGLGAALIALTTILLITTAVRVRSSRATRHEPRHPGAARNEEPRGSDRLPRHLRGCSSMVEPQSSKLITRVRFPSSPPQTARSMTHDENSSRSSGALAMSSQFTSSTGSRSSPS